ncbi:phosphoribosylpyrophosphate synthetase [Pedobacter sp.]|uniref:phosphoribosylpyrophosphate synthetase n=1 Tax=Pedobacter sp. TaxID=1411316 RepID=UPI003C5B11FC
MNELNHIGEMTTLSQVISGLEKDGYLIDFNLASDETKARINPLQEHPENFSIDKSYRFEGASDPDDEAIVYAISSWDGKIRGLLVDGYGISSDVDLSGIILRLGKSKT